MTPLEKARLKYLESLQEISNLQSHLEDLKQLHNGLLEDVVIEEIKELKGGKQKK